MACGSDTPEEHNVAPAVVFACLQTGEFRILIHPGMGLAFGGAPVDVRTELIPFGLQIPNSRLWVACDEKWNVLRAWCRE